jgi:hypothetical protein
MYALPGYDSMWTDMSEIVRPTRDGIHGREFISTSVDIGRKPNKLSFDAQGHLTTHLTEMIDRPVPFLLDVTRFDSLTTSMVEGYAIATKELQSLLLLPYGRMGEAQKAAGSLVPVLGIEDDISKADLSGVQMVEIEETPDWKQRSDQLRQRYPKLIIGIRVPSRMGMEDDVYEMAKKVDVIHILFLESGMEEGGRWAKDALRTAHRHLVRKGIRDEVTLVSGGGISAAEMVPKSIICGADAICLERALRVALECRACSCHDLSTCRANIGAADATFVSQRVINMGNAWRDQLLEVLGAMGLKEVRRLRGETGRAIFQEEQEPESFANLGAGVR